MLKLVLETEYLYYLVSELFLPVFFWAGSIQLNLVEHFYKNKYLMLSWQSSSKWFKRLTKVWLFAKCLISYTFFKWAGWPVRFRVIRIIKRSTSLIWSFNIKVTTEPWNYKRYLLWLAEGSYVDKIFVC